GPGSSACTMRRESKRVSSGIASRKSVSVTCGNSSTPDGTRKHLKPTTPAFFSAESSLVLPGTTPPQNPTSTKHLFSAAASFALKPETLVVGGIEFNGISTSVVTPPAAAACVAV